MLGLRREYAVTHRKYYAPEISQYYTNEQYINCIVNRGKEHDLSTYDHIIFSYHGLPERQVDKVYTDGYLCKDHHCEDEFNDTNAYCYKAACYNTTKSIVDKLNIPKDKYTVSFQSRLDNKWLTPFSDKVIEDLAKKGAKNVLVFSPAFTADCLETIYEIGTEYDEIFKEHGGEKITLVGSLNTNEQWVKAVKDIVGI